MGLSCLPLPTAACTTLDILLTGIREPSASVGGGRRWWQEEGLAKTPPTITVSGAVFETACIYRTKQKTQRVVAEGFILLGIPSMYRVSGGMRVARLPAFR